MNDTYKDPLIPNTIDSNPNSIEIGVDCENKKENTNNFIKSSRSSKSKNNPFLHNYENEIIYSNNHNEYTIKKFLGSGVQVKFTLE